MLFPPFEPDRDEPRRRRFRPIPVRTLLPNVITLLALCAGLTAVRLAIEGKLELALGAIVLAAVLDGIDGRIARLIKGEPRECLWCPNMWSPEIDYLMQASFPKVVCIPSNNQPSHAVDNDIDLCLVRCRDHDLLDEPI